MVEGFVGGSQECGGAGASTIDTSIVWGDSVQVRSDTDILIDLAVVPLTPPPTRVLRGCLGGLMVGRDQVQLQRCVSLRVWCKC